MKYVLSEDKAQEKGKRIVVNCCYCFIFAVRLSYMNNTCLAVVGVNEHCFLITLLCTFFCTKMSFFLLWTLKMMHVFPRGLSVNFLIAILKRFLVILSIFSDCL